MAEERAARHHGLLVGAHVDHVLRIEDLGDAQLALRDVEGLGRVRVRVRVIPAMSKAWVGCRVRARVRVRVRVRVGVGVGVRVEVRVRVRSGCRACWWP